jgi:retinol dehydrogenase-12
VNSGFLSYFKFLLFLAQPIYSVFTKSSEQGAQTTIHCAVSDNIIQYSGCYFTDCKLKKPSEQARNKEFALRLWKMSEEMVGLAEKKDN